VQVGFGEGTGPEGWQRCRVRGWGGEGEQAQGRGQRPGEQGKGWAPPQRAGGRGPGGQERGGAYGDGQGVGAWEVGSETQGGGRGDSESVGAVSARGGLRGFGGGLRGRGAQRVWGWVEQWRPGWGLRWGRLGVKEVVGFGGGCRRGFPEGAKEGGACSPEASSTSQGAAGRCWSPGRMTRGTPRSPASGDRVRPHHGRIPARRRGSGWNASP